MNPIFHYGADLSLDYFNFTVALVAMLGKRVIYQLSFLWLFTLSSHLYSKKSRISYHFVLGFVRIYSFIIVLKYEQHVQELLIPLKRTSIIK